MARALSMWNLQTRPSRHVRMDFAKHTDLCRWAGKSVRQILVDTAIATFKENARTQAQHNARRCTLAQSPCLTPTRIPDEWEVKQLSSSRERFWHILTFGRAAIVGELEAC